MAGCAAPNAPNLHAVCSGNATPRWPVLVPGPCVSFSEEQDAPHSANPVSGTEQRRPAPRPPRPGRARPPRASPATGPHLPRASPAAVLLPGAEGRVPAPPRQLLRLLASVGLGLQGGAGAAVAADAAAAPGAVVRGRAGGLGVLLQGLQLG